MKVDRELQREILKELKNVFPKTSEFNEPSFDNGEIKNLIANLYYLEEHGLLKITTKQLLRDKSIIHAKITAKGIDFIEDDSGLSAILNNITIKIIFVNMKKEKLTFLHVSFLF